MYLGPIVLLIQLVRLIRADGDLALLTYERFGMMPGKSNFQVSSYLHYLMKLNHQYNGL